MLLRSEEFAWKVGAQYAGQESTGSRNSWDPVSGAEMGQNDPEGGGGAGPLHRCPSIAVTDTTEGADPEGGGWGEVG